MRRWLIGALIGVVAGIIDVVPMLWQRLPWRADLSAFLQWVVLGVIIAHIEMRVPGWLKGLIVSELAAAPILILVTHANSLHALPIVIMSAILGCLVGWATSRWARESS
jgi:hypothetical protein